MKRNALFVLCAVLMSSTASFANPVMPSPHHTVNIARPHVTHTPGHMAHPDPMHAAHPAPHPVAKHPVRYADARPVHHHVHHHSSLARDLIVPIATAVTVAMILD